MKKDTEITEITAEVFIVVDGDGGWAAMGLSDKSPRTHKEIKDLITEFNLANDLGFCKLYRVRVKLPVPSSRDIEELIAEWDKEDLGMMT